METQEYWIKRNQMKEQACLHTKEMSTKYAAEIERCVERTMLYDQSNVAAKKGGRTPVCKIVPLDVVSAIMESENIVGNTSGKTCVLNFASFKIPGGMFLAGSIAQEECLCHGGYLYNVLSSNRLRPAYEYNKTCLNRALYQNHAFYTPDVRFFQNDRTKTCDVITCAAPNFSTAHRYCRVTSEENSIVLRERIKFVLDVMAAQNVSCPILGAYGCGVFGQNPEEVARIFKEELTSGAYPFEYALFAIIPRDTKIIDTFKSVFEQS